MKKITAILLSVLMLASVLCIGVSATETSVSVKLTGAVQATKGETYTVALSVDDATVGGLQGTITYDKDSFVFKGIEITASMATANRITESEAVNLINSVADGTIKFVVLGDGTSKQLVKLNFTTKDDPANAKADFKLADVTVSNGDGTATVTNTTTNITEPKIHATAISVNGASVKTDGQADIRFETAVARTDIDLHEVGVIMIPKKFLVDDQEIIYSEESIYSGKKAAIAKLTVNSDNTITAGEKIYANLNLSANTDSRIKMEIAARAYVKLSDDTIIYSDNADSAKNINGGTSVRSCIDVIKAIASENEYTGNDILNAENSKWTKDNYETVVKALRDKTASK